jgi:hypothetical protein
MKVVLIVVAAALAAVTSVIVALIILNLGAQVPATNAKLNNEGYLGGTKLFLVSATSAYGVHDGQTCFIINATVRNDYTAQDPPPMDNYGGNSSGAAFFGLTATLHGKTGQINASNIDRGVPLGVPQVGLDSSQTYEYEIDLATSSRNIEGYLVVIVGLAGYPIP